VNNAEDSDRRQKLRRFALLLSLLAIAGMGSVTVACSPRHEKPAETSVPASTNPSETPPEKNVRTNVTRTPMSAVPPGGGGNPAIPCGFGPAGGLPCSNNSN
jgi:hypothetical protein